MKVYRGRLQNYPVPPPRPHPRLESHQHKAFYKPPPPTFQAIPGGKGDQSPSQKVHFVRPTRELFAKHKDMKEKCAQPQPQPKDHRAML